MRQGRLPPFGFEKLEFGFREPVKTPFLAFFDCRKNVFWRWRSRKMRQVSPLRVRIFGVRASGACFGQVFGVFRCSENLFKPIFLILSHPPANPRANPWGRAPGTRLQFPCLTTLPDLGVDQHRRPCSNMQRGAFLRIILKGGPYTKNKILETTVLAFFGVLIRVSEAPASMFGLLSRCCTFWTRREPEGPHLSPFSDPVYFGDFSGKRKLFFLWSGSKKKTFSFEVPGKSCLGAVWEFGAVWGLESLQKRVTIISPKTET